MAILTLLLGATACSYPRGVPETNLEPYRAISFETTEGTAMNVDVAPDGKEIAFDLLGDIYTLPIDGGTAKLLVGGRSWDTAPRYSPDGTQIVFVSDRDGQDALWTADRNGNNASLLASYDLPSAAVLGAPVWSPDGSEIAVRWGLTDIAIIHVASRSVDLLQRRGKDGSSAPAHYASSPAFAPDKRFILFDEQNINETFGRIARIDRATNERTVISADADATSPAGMTWPARGWHEYRPVASRSGRWLAYVRYDLERRTALCLRDLQDGEERELLLLPDDNEPYRFKRYDEPHQNFAFTPDDREIVLSMGGKIWRVSLGDGRTQLVPFRATVLQQVVPTARAPLQSLGDGKVHIRAIRSPTLSPDARTMIFTAVGRLWIQDMHSGTLRRLTDSNDGEYGASISPDGQWVVYLSYPDTAQTWNGHKHAPAQRHIMLTRLDRVGSSGTATHEPRTLTQAPGDYGVPVWFPDGQRILFSLSSTRSDSADPLFQSRVYAWTDTTGRAPTEVSPAPSGPSRLAEGADDRWGMRVSADGTRLYYVEYETPRFATTIVSIRLDGSDRHTHVTIRGNPGVVAISPDAAHALVGPHWRAGVYLVRIPSLEESAADVALDDPAVRQVDEGFATHAFWLNDTTAFYGLGPTLSEVTVGKGEGEEFHAVQLDLPRRRPIASLAVRGAQIITMVGERGREQVIENGTIVVQNGRIAAVGRASRVSIPRDATIINGKGLTIVPGFIDVHMHDGRGIVPRPTLDADEISSLAYGVTTRYDPHSSVFPEADLERQEKIEVGYTPGPRYFYSSKCCLAGDVPTLDSARDIAALSRALGGIILKEYQLPTRKHHQWLAQAAAERGIGITGHVEGLKASLTRAADGFTALEHSALPTRVFQDVASFMALSGVNYTPTFLMHPGAHRSYYQEMLRDDPAESAKYFRFRWPGYFDNSLADAADARQLRFERLRLDSVGRSAAAVIDAGGLVSIGAHNVPGLFTHWEMWTLHRGGASAMDVLRAATLNGAKKIGVDHEVGSLEVGKLADFVALSANPLDDIRNTTKIKYVVADAIVYDGRTMTRLWPGYQPLPRMSWQTPEQYVGFRHARPLE